MINLTPGNHKMLTLFCGFRIEAIYCILYSRIEAAASRPRREHVPRRVTSFSGFDKTPSPGFANHDQKPSAGNNFDGTDHSGYSLSPAPPSYNQTMGSRGKYMHAAC